MPAQGPDLLVFSASPAIPKGEINVPKASSTGRLTGSSIRTAQPVLPAGVGELSRAEVVMPSISINSRTAPTVIGAGHLPSCKRRRRSRRQHPSHPVQPTLRPCSIFCLLESHQVNRWWRRSTETGSGESPLRDYENSGGPVYTAAINAPNFTSKRGSWIFRFAELPAMGRAFTNHSSGTTNSTLRGR